MELLQEKDYEREFEENQKIIRDRILESMKDISNNSGRDYNEFFDELEKRYTNAQGLRIDLVNPDFLFIQNEQ